MCSLGFPIQKKVDDSSLYYFTDKGSIKITSKIGSFGTRSFIRTNRLNFDKIRIFHKRLRSLCGAERKLVKKKITEANFSNLVSNLLYTYLKKSTEKL